MMTNHQHRGGGTHQTSIITNYVATFLLVATMVLSFQVQNCIGVSPNRRNVAFVPSTTLKRSSSDGSSFQKRIAMLSPLTSFIASTFEEQSSTQLLLLDSTKYSISQQQENSMVPIEQLSPTATLIVFIIGIIPFIWATVEFWRRIAVGASFGTSADSVVIPSPFSDDDQMMVTIGEDDNPESSRGRRTLDRGALTVAYVLFAVAAGSVGLAIASVVMGPTQQQ